MIKCRIAILFLLTLFASQVYSADTLDPYALRLEALRDFDKGEVGKAQEKLIQAYELFVQSANYDMASMCLYERAIEYMNIQDLQNMWQQAEMLHELNEHHRSAFTAYNYHSVASGYYSYLDSGAQAIAHAAQAIRWMEQIDNPAKYNIMPVWSYYNMAFMYDMHCQPPMVDSVRYYLTKAREVIENQIKNVVDSIEALISVVDMEAWLEYYEGDYDAAEKMMKEVVAMIDIVAQDSPNTIIAERGEAYSFLAMLYGEQGKWEQAYMYQQKLIENNELRYDVEKRRVLQEVQTQYEVEKQYLEKEKLKAEKKLYSAWLVVCVIGCSALVMLLIILYLRKKSTEGKLYEAALEADNIRQALVRLESQTDVEPLQLLVDGLVEQLAARNMSVNGFKDLDLGHIQILLSKGKKITTMDKRYILCFAAGMSVEEIADFMCLEPGSVYTVRYRLRKKFASEYPFPY